MCGGATGIYVREAIDEIFRREKEKQQKNEAE